MEQQQQNSQNSKIRYLKDQQQQQSQQNENYQPVDYQKENEELRQLALERQKRMQQQQQGNPEQQQQQQQEQQQIKQQINKEQQYQQQQQQNQQNQSIHIQKQSQFYLNKLKNYPEEEHTNYMVNFEQLLLEDPFYKQHNKQKSNKVQSVFMTTFGFCPEFLYKQIANQKQINFVLANDRSKEDFQSGNCPDVVKDFYQCKNWTLIHPPKDYNQRFVGPFHPKLWLLKFPDFLRVVVTSGNLTEDDWISWGQGVWFQDFQRKNLYQLSENKKNNNNKNEFDYNEDFYQTLKYFVKKIMPAGQDYKQLLKIDLSEYHFDNVNVVLIPGLQGRHNGENFDKQNKGKLKFVLNLLKQKKKYANPTLTYTTSSCGNLNEDFLEEMINALSPGSQNLKELQENRKQRKKNKTVYEASKNMKLIYPTLNYILNDTLLGVEMAQVLCLQKDHFKLDSFPKRIMHRYEGNKEYFYHHGVIPHIKLGILTDSDIQVNDDSVIYFGSHNFSKGAWGSYEKDMTQMFNCNTELGIIFPPKEGSAQIKQEFIKNVPFNYPPNKYQGNDRPFMWGDMQN